MKRTIIITLTVGLVVALAVVAYSSYKRYSRPNLLVDGSFDAGEGLSKSWYQLEPSEQGSFGKTEDGAAYVDTIGIVDSERNPFCEHVLAQAVEVEVREPRTFILTGKAKRLTGTGTALVQLSVHGIKQISNSDSLRLDKGVGKWTDFALTVTPEQLPYAVDVFLGVYGEGRAAFDSLDLVRGEPRGGDLGRAAMLAGIVLLFYAAAIALLELFSAKLSKPEPPAPYEMEK